MSPAHKMAHVEIKLLVSIFAGRIVMERGKKCRWFSCWTQQFSIPTDYQRRVSKSQRRFESNLVPRTLPNKGFWWVFNIVKYIVLCMKCNVVKTMPCLPPIFLGMVTIPHKNGDFPAGYEIVLPTVGKDCTVARWSVEQSKTAPW